MVNKKRPYVNTTQDFRLDGRSKDSVGLLIQAGCPGFLQRLSNFFQIISLSHVTFDPGGRFAEICGKGFNGLTKRIVMSV